MTPKAVIPRSASDEGSPLMEEGYALLQLLPKEFLPLGRGGDPSQKAFGMTLRVGWEGVFCPFRLKRRSLASLEMTGYENHFCLSGKSWKGGEALVPI